MSGYRRFVAYVYEYLKEKKGNNCGFIKVEVREQRCTLEVHLQCPGIPAQSECRIYGFVRNGGLMDGNLLDTCKAENGTIECRIETNPLNMKDTGVALGKMGGIILITDSGAFFGTEWDDNLIRPENFREVKRTPRDRDEMGTSVSERGIPRKQISAPEMPKQEMPEKEPLKQRTDQIEMPKQNISGKEPLRQRMAEIETPKQSVPEKELSEQRISEAEESKREADKQEVTRQKRSEAEKKERAVTEPCMSKSAKIEQVITESSESDSVIWNNKTKESTLIPEMIKSGIPQPEASEATQQKSEIQERVREIQEPEISESVEPEVQMSEAEIPSVTWNSAVQSETKKVSSHQEQKEERFEDGDFTDCRRIQLKDLVHLHRRDAGLRNNRFLQYGYYNFGHLLICRKADGQYVLGVPGGYDQQERFMASMFGFPYFRESRYIQLPKGRGGYWYRLINTPNFH